MPIQDIGGDRLTGVDEIAQFRGEKPRRTRYLLERGLIPHGREGNLFIASKERLRRHHVETTSGAAPCLPEEDLNRPGAGSSATRAGREAHP